MTTTTQGGRITGLLALTCIGSEALQVGDPVHLIDDYEVEKADGTKEILGHVSVANVKRDATTAAYPVANVGGDCTVEARGFEVRSVTLGGNVAAGARVGFNGTDYVAYTGVPGTAGNSATVALVGIALIGGVDNDVIDILVR